jgi:hypothetical protein
MEGDSVRPVRGRSKTLNRGERRDMATGMRALLATIEQGDLAASSSMVARLDGAVLALDALDAPGAPRATKQALIDTADFLSRLAELVDSGDLDAVPGMASALEGGADTLEALAEGTEPRQK